MFPANSKTTEQKPNLTHHYLTAVLALTALITSPQIKAEDYFTDLGFLPNVTYERSVTYGVSADGSVVVGYSYNANSDMKAFRWTLETGMESVEDWLSNAGVSIAA